jgi:predicted RecB family nuclease
VKRETDALRLAATDLANHLACRHLTTLEQGSAEGRWKPPNYFRPEADVLAQRGLEHERAYLAHLEAQGKTVTRLDPENDGRSALERTLAAMFAGAEVIAQATLTVGRWFGRADVLLRVDRPSPLGAWSYEALDTKLARETKAGAVLQLCLYSELLAQMQGLEPEHMHVVPRRPGFPLETYRVDDYLAYYRLVRRRLEAAVDAREAPATYPEPVSHCEICRWFPRCDQQRRADDHLSLVAGVSRMQTRELQSRDIDTLARLAIEPVPIAWKPDRGAKEGYLRVREQARVQLRGRTERRPHHELLPIVPGHGLTLLPEPSPGDLFLDFEGDPYVDDGGLEYLFGWVVSDPPPAGLLELEVGPPVYHPRWALDRAAERAAFETLIDTIMRRWETDRNMHVYHYGAYEPGAVKRLMGHYATRESDVDRLLRGGRFVDLHAIVKQALRASVEEYSIKKLEPFYGYQRVQPLEQAGPALRVIERGLEVGSAIPPDVSHTAIVEAYNRDDCLSTLALRAWLEALRAGVERGGTEVPRPPVEPDQPNEKVRERERRANDLAARLLAGIPEEGRSDEEQARWLLAHLLDWHRREEKSAWWEYFRLREMSDEQLLDEMPALSGLVFEQRLAASGRTPVERYRFQAQETKIREGDTLHMPLPDSRELGEVVAIDLTSLSVDIRKRGTCADVQPTSVFAHDSYNSTEQFESLMRLGGWVADHGIDAPGPWRAARDLLLRRGPRLGAGPGGALEAPGEGGVEAARRLALLLDHAALAIQGPPGAGKTFTGAHMICDLVRAGKRVGVCAQSHKVIANLLTDVVKYAREQRVRVACLRKVTEKSVPPDPGIAETTDNAEVAAALRGGQAHVVGGTSYLWSREMMFEAADVLFVDEAGQMSLANVMAIAQGAKSLVLLGDPQQLEQPIQGTHPEGTEVSALEHVIGNAQTIAPERGLFLEETWRLAPAICEFTSELFYARRLHSRPGLERQALLGETPFAGAGLWFVPVEHDANQSSSQEEVEVIAGLVGALGSGRLSWRDGDGHEHPLGLEDILVIAPYNAQVFDLHQRLPAEVRVGTVDRFQGQQAPVVIYSLTTSTPQDAPRGMDFLYDPNRFNVATSRAKCACIVVGSPRLFEPDCQSPKQMKLANAFCRFLEVARELPGVPAAERTEAR